MNLPKIKFIEEEHANLIPVTTFTAIDINVKKLSSNPNTKDYVNIPFNNEVTKLKEGIKNFLDIEFSYDGYHAYLSLSGNLLYLNIFRTGDKKFAYMIFDKYLCLIDVDYLDSPYSLLSAIYTINKRLK